MATRIEPVPKSFDRGGHKDRWSLTSMLNSPSLLEPTPKRFTDVVADRRTIRELSPLNLDQTMAIVRAIALPQQLGVGKNHGLSRKVTISAGSLHPIEILIIAGPEVLEPVIYCDTIDLFGTVAIRDEAPFHDEVDKLRSFLPNSTGHLLMLVGNAQYLEQYYDNAASLLWRDAGAILQMFGLFAAAHAFGFVPLGSSGSGVLNTIVTPHRRYVPAGTALIGRPITP